MPVIKVHDIYQDHPCQTYIPVIRPTLKFANGYIKLISNEGPLPEYEYVRSTIIELDFNDDLTIEGWNLELDIAISQWENALDVN